jgi:medium-chain acyl-[acyl-carrier-protein] hydrolase
MPLTIEELESLQADEMADDVAIDLAKMSAWTEQQARAYFESGGAVDPAAEGLASASFTSGASADTGSTAWLRCLAKKPDATHRVIFFNWTGNRGGQGSSHSLMRPNWSTAMADAEVHEVLLPGRGTRQKEPLYTRVTELVHALAAALGPALRGGKPYAFVGFSFGAVLAYELAAEIAARDPGEGPALVCAVSAEGPSWPHRLGTQHTLGDEAYIAMLAEKKGTDIILRDAGLTKLYVPVIRADMALEETYAPLHTTPPRLGVPMLAFYGEEGGRDHMRTWVARGAAELWMQTTAAVAASRVVPLPGVDWYVLQEPAGTAAVQEAVGNFMRTLLLDS